jgi:hypothetical protein
VQPANGLSRHPPSIHRDAPKISSQTDAIADAFPQINLYPSIVLQTRNGQLLTVLDHLRPRVTVPHNYLSLPTHIGEVATNAAALLQAVHTELGVALTPSPLTAFPGFPMSVGLRAVTSASQTISFLKSSPRLDEFLLVTGTESHYLMPQPRVQPCAGHTWSECRFLGENQGNAAIVSRSYDPASFFTTVELHHCAHRTVHNRRTSRCHIVAFEEFLCAALASFRPFAGHLRSCMVDPANAQGTAALTPQPIPAAAR